MPDDKEPIEPINPDDAQHTGNPPAPTPTPTPTPTPPPSFGS